MYNETQLQAIPTHLIESALKLTGKKIEDMNIKIWQYHEWDIHKWEHFSIEKFAYFLLSPEFIRKYRKPSTYEEWAPEFEWAMQVEEFWWAIYEYQSWNPEPLINLLKKIPWRKQSDNS